VSNANTEPRSYSPDEARKAYFPSLGRGAFYGYLRQNLIPHIRLGKRIIIPRSAIEKFLEDCTTGGKARPAA
jgi:hypothetical protein